MYVTDQNQYKLGMTGLALLRNWLTGESSKNDAILRDMRETLQTVSTADVSKEDLKKYSTDTGYARWASNYDDTPNLLIDAEEPVVTDIIKKIKPGKAIDLACGTGRYTSLLSTLGHTVTGIDQSSPMLEIAKKKCPDVEFLCSDVTKVALPEKSFDLAISALALTHFSKVESPITEATRLVKTGGTIVLSDIHPAIVALGGHADFQTKSGDRGFITNHVHWHSEYLSAFRKNGLEVVDCLEPKLEAQHVRILKEAFGLREVTMQTALEGLPIALIWIVVKK